VRPAVRAVRDWAMSNHLIEAANAKKFEASLLRKYFRSKNTEVHSHGNAKLSVEDEEILLGFIEASVSSGDSMGPIDVRMLAEYMFDMKFGEKWYRFLLVK
jgi:hypothetical protein